MISEGDRFGVGLRQAGHHVDHTSELLLRQFDVRPAAEPVVLEEILLNRALDLIANRVSNAAQVGPISLGLLIAVVYRQIPDRNP